MKEWLVTTIFTIIGFVVGYFFGRLVRTKKRLPDDPTQPAPLDTQCPVCDAPPGMFCDTVFTRCHGGRFDKSKKANTERLSSYVESEK